MLGRTEYGVLLMGVDYLHQCGLVHTNISPNNVLQGIDDESVLSQIEHSEASHPTARKPLKDRTLYLSRPMPITFGKPVLADLGEARIGRQKHTGDVMPGIYRAPEVILGMEWDSKVDIWSVGVMVSACSRKEQRAKSVQAWDAVEGGQLFFGLKNGMLNDEQHLAEMVSLMGPPPREFLDRSEKCREYWDSQGIFSYIRNLPERLNKITVRLKVVYRHGWLT